MEKNTGGPAFPLPYGAMDDHDRGGMTLRDWFAGKAVHYMLRDYGSNELAAKACYEFADAMLKAREQ